MLATAAMANPFKWEDHLRPLHMAYNTSVNPTTGYNPFFLMFGCQARMPIDVIYGQPRERVSPQEHAVQLGKRLEAAYHHVRERMGHKLDRQKAYYDKHIHDKPYSEGELVWLHSTVVPKGQGRKFHRPWTGPYKIS